MHNAQKTTQTKNLKYLEDKKDLHNMFEKSEYSFTLLSKLIPLVNYIKQLIKSGVMKLVNLSISERVSDILNIIKNTSIHKIAIGNNCINYPIVDKYKGRHQNMKVKYTLTCICELLIKRF